jgi:hypothetical protein
MNCYIFGAGASKCYKDSPTGQSMPIAKDFFRTLNNLSIASNPWVLVGHVINYVKETRGVDPFDFIHYNEDIEILHSEIFEKFLNAQKKNDFENIHKYSAANIQLAFMFVSAFNEIQNGPVSITHSNFIDTLNSGDSILTFNWDTLLDRSLFSSGKWFPDTGYGIVPKQIFRNEWMLPQNNESKYSLIKLHGSTNWLTSYPVWNENELIFSHTTGDSDVFVYQETTDPYPCYDGRFMAGYEPFSYGYYPPNLFVDSIKPEDGHIFVRYTLRNGMNNQGSAPSNGIESMPLIITPVKQKEYGRFGNLFEKLWNMAYRSIKEADRIFIIGYSFPQTDLRSNELFSKAFMERNSIPEVIIINPFPEYLKDKFILEFGIPVPKISIDKCYIDSSYDFAKWRST